jgi:hypothetical protein
MLGNSDRQLSSALRRGVERFTEWRRTHELGTRIPDSLWKLATNLASTHGVSRTACALKLDYYSLKRRVEEKSSTVLTSSSAASNFIELPASTLAGSGECVIEFESPDGAKMRIQLKGAATSDLVALSRSFWNDE